MEVGSCWLTLASPGGLSREWFARVGAIACAIPCLRWVLDRLLFKRWALAVLLPGGSKKGDLTSTALKFQESAWKLTVYLTCAVLGWWVVLRGGWLADPDLFWRDWPLQRASRALRAYYELEAGFYAASSVMLVFWEVRRRDFGIMLLHHVVTVTLIVLSQHIGILRIGSAVMALHDVNDVLLESAKLASYACCPGAGTVLFVLFVACWAVLRLGIFPLRVIRSCWLGAREALGFWPGCQLEINLLLLALLAMHLYWFVLILRVALRKIRGGKLSDAREE